MCGLFGFDKTSHTTDLMTPVLALFMESRGKESWGVTDGVDIYKTVGEISETFWNFELESPLYHTRQSSIGEVSERNAHPFKFTHNGKTVVGAHNGCISNHMALKNKYPERKDFQVDSEHIFAHLAEGKDVAEIGGWGVVIWYEYPENEPEKRVRYFSRFNNEAFNIAKLSTGEFVFASTQSSIEIAANLACATIKQFYKTEPKNVYYIEDGELLYLDKKLNWGAHPVEFAHVVYTGGDNSHYKSKWTCAMSLCKAMVAKDEIVCGHCFQEIAVDIYGDTATA